MDEPVQVWQQSGMLEASYRDPQTYGFPAQMHFLSTRLDEHRRVVQQNPEALGYISERSPFTDVLFWKTNTFTGRIPQRLDFVYMDIWRHWQRCVAPFEQPDYFIYLDTSLDSCQARIALRKRTEEDGIPLPYLTALHEYHAQYFDLERGALMPNGARVPVIRIDGELDFRRQDVARDVACQVREQINWD